MTRSPTPIVVTMIIDADEHGDYRFRVDVTPAAQPLRACDVSWDTEERVDRAALPVYSPAGVSNYGPEVTMGTRPRRRLLVIGGLVLVVLLAAVTIGPRSGPTRTASTPTATIEPPGSSVARAATPPPPTPLVCQGDAPFSSEGCPPDRSGSIPSGTLTAGCLSLIQSAAQAMTVDPNSYSQVVSWSAVAPRTIDDVVADQLGHAKLFLASQLQTAGATADPEAIDSLQAFDTAIAAAKARPCSDPVTLTTPS
jgi:hypothetical protein